MDDRDNRLVDELLDASLRNYGRTGPRAGLEDRVLAGVRTRRQAASRRKAWAWTLAVAGVAAVVGLIVVHWRHRQPAALPLTAKSPAFVSAPVVANSIPIAKVAAPHRRARSTPQREADTRPQQFPTPRPLSEQENLLILYATALEQSSANSVTNSATDAGHGLEILPISIAAIKIEPLRQARKLEDGPGEGKQDER